MKPISAKMAVVALVCALFCGIADLREASAHPEDCPAFNGGYAHQLTPEQMEAARQIFNNNFASMDTTRQALAAKRAELNSVLASPQPDGAKIESLSREIGELRGKMLAARAEVRSQLARNGLPTDFYGPEGEGPDNRAFGPRHGYHHPRHRGYQRGGCGCW